ncbi:uncharacterized protein A4U43_C08F3780 [Asparagus officinalis]|uniref:uncharacterized protein LOC109819965 n=1 Tax=Asparagus officinalis TaxID=4686 RepID=UPI00098E6E3B|nr:uncharacterized protein LOC109819965 [Asparagus officinalis]ONK59178.1 uncharacterized protein A4U43_C08F3780 [Asparagus officinalis]
MRLQPHSLHLSLPRPFLGFQFHPQIPNSLHSISSPNPRISCCNLSRGESIRPRAKKKDNVWSVDNELAEREKEKERKRSSSSFGRRRKRGKRVKAGGRKGKNELVLVSAAMLIEIETVLQTQEPVIKPAWSTFTSSLSGIWMGVGAVFSPFTAEMEPIGIGSRDQNLYDCYTLSRIERSPEGSQIRRKINWVALNPFGERRQNFQGSYKDYDGDNSDYKLGTSDVENPDLDLPSFEEDSMSMEPGLVFFEDGSYSRGPIEIPVGEHDESKYFLSPTFKFEQCLVKGCHKRLRIMHTIEFSEGGSDIQIIRVAVYEEQWISPVNLHKGNDDQVDLKPISQRRRTQPSELVGSWKVFEVSATPIFNEEAELVEEGAGPPYVYLCTETLKKRSLPENSAHFGEEEMLDMNDVTVLWLPGGVTAYVDVSKDGILCLGVGWYSDEGVNLVMERDYGMDGKLKEVRWKSELKRRWTDPVSP